MLLVNVAMYSMKTSFSREGDFFGIEPSNLIINKMAQQEFLGK